VRGISTSLPGATEARLEALRGRVEAFERHLAVSAPRSAQLLRLRLTDLQDALLRLTAQLHGVCAAETSLRASADDLGRLLGRRVATSVDGLEALRNRIAVAVAAVHADLVDTLARLGRRLDPATLVALRRLRQLHESVDAELGIAVACRLLTSGLRGRGLEARRVELARRSLALRTELDARRAELAAHRERSAALWRQLDAGLRDEVEQIGVALESLLAAPRDRMGTSSPVARAGKQDRAASRSDVVER
jgi:hypothetical protein